MAEWADFNEISSGAGLDDVAALEEMFGLQQQRPSGGLLGQPAPDEGVVIQPQAHSVLKGRQESGEKVFVNLCTHPKVEAWHYKQLLEDEAPAGEDNQGVRIPLSVGERVECCDKEGKPCTAFDVVFNPGTLQECTKEPALKQLLARFSLAAVSHKYGLKLSEEFSFPKLRYKGQEPPRSQRIKLTSHTKIEELESTVSLLSDIPSTTTHHRGPAKMQEITEEDDKSRQPAFEAWFAPPPLATEFLHFLKEDQSYSRTSVFPRSGRSAGEPAGSGSRGKAGSDPPYFGLWKEERQKIAQGCDSKETSINAFDFDGIIEDVDDAGENSKKGGSAPGAYTPASTTGDGALPLKKAFLLSPEEKRKQVARQKCLISRSTLAGTVFVLQLDLRSLNDGSCPSCIASDPSAPAACAKLRVGAPACDPSLGSAGEERQTEIDLASTPTVTISDHHLLVSVPVADPFSAPAQCACDCKSKQNAVSASAQAGQNDPARRHPGAPRKKEFLYRFPLPMCSLFAKGMVSSAYPFLLNVVIPTDMEAAAAMEAFFGGGSVPACEPKAPVECNLVPQGTGDSSFSNDSKEKNSSNALECQGSFMRTGLSLASAGIKPSTTQAEQARTGDTRNAGFANEFLDAVF
ncbi:pre-rna processing pih1 nop17 protein [Cystoisospora suis]|uniref:Pre-rna processing pih1 nop17 protein n=1 Tax=Cystoisospora suis TaxID=483139 RepID=A0A2C6L7Q0_9APIC|nr:pre-rna processing pih1 nop17 protein [Cystoisospora suis]